MPVDRYTLDYRVVTPASGRVGRAGVDAAARVHVHDTEDVRGLPEAIAALEAADSELGAAIESLADRMLVHEDGEVLTGQGNVLLKEA